MLETVVGLYPDVSWPTIYLWFSVYFSCCKIKSTLVWIMLHQLLMWRIKSLELV